MLFGPLKWIRGDQLLRDVHFQTAAKGIPAQDRGRSFSSFKFRKRREEITSEEPNFRLDFEDVLVRFNH